MSGYKRTNIPSVAKTFRLTPELVEDMERVLFLTREGKKPKYRSMTNLLVVAIRNLIKRERRSLENQGVVWEHLNKTFRDPLQENTDGEKD